MLYRTILAAGLLLGAQSAIAEPITPPLSVKADANVLINIETKGEKGHCSGAWARTVMGDVIITAGHCAEDLLTAGKLTVVDSLGRESNARTVFYDEQNDTAILRSASAKPHESLKPACHREVKLGDKVKLTGYPAVFGRVTVTGDVASDPGPLDDYWHNVWRVTMYSAPGDSGGAVVNADGEQIGILVGNSPKYPGLSFVTPISTLCHPGLV